MSDASYGLDTIKVMDDMEHIRARYGMYIGDNENPRQLWSEAFDNALDESQAGRSKLTEVYIDTHAKYYSVRDYGQGIPIGEIQDKSGKMIEAVQLLANKSFSGAKFNNQVYKIRTGLHGVGMGCINALSSRFEITTRRSGEAVYYTSSKGESENLVKYRTSLDSGVTISFTPDSEIFESINIPLDFIRNRCKIAKAFGHPVKLMVDNNEEEMIVNELADLIPEDESSLYHKLHIRSNLENGEFIEVAIKYTSDTSTKFYGYTNLLYNRYGGTHVRLIDRAVEEVWQKFYSETDVVLKNSDCKVGLNLLVAVFINNPAFDGQTKEKLSSKNGELQPLIDKFKIEFEKALRSNPEIRKALLNRFSEYRISQNKLTSRKEIMELVKLNNTSERGTARRRSSIARGLIECTSTSTENTELYVVEGDSAGGTAARARDKRIQAVLPLRGKIKNVTWMSVADALKSDDILKLVNAAGCGAGDEADPELCRYERIIFAADADPDGKHIVALDLGAAIKLLAPLVKAGKIYVLEPPLFGYTDKSGIRIYANSFEELPEGVRSSGDFTRYKGLGEFDDDEFKESCMIHGKRNLYRVNYPDNIDEFSRILGTTQGRKDLMLELGVIKYIDEIRDDEEEF